LGGVTALASTTLGTPKPSRRERAGRVVAGALRGALLATVVAGLAWLLAGAIAGTAFLVLVAASVVMAGATLLSDRAIPPSWWIALLVAWAAVLVEREAVGGHGGVIVGAAAWLGVIAGARSAGIGKWALPLLAYPLISAAIVILADRSLLHPWGISWLWVAAVLGPVLGLRVLLDPSPREHPVSR
jgi:hypothetical protein